MSSPAHKTVNEAPLDFSRWRNLPVILMAVGGVLAAIGAFANTKQFGYSWLQSFMFFLSIALGGWFLVLAHHLFDASWSVGIRRINEQIACLLPWMALLFIPIALLREKIYPWIAMLRRHEMDHALHSKHALLNETGFFVVSIACFIIWSFFSLRLRHWSLEQDRTGDARCTFKMRKLSYFGIILFAFSVTLGVIMWMKSLQHQFFSTMYGVYYFAGSVWLTLATVYVLTMVFRRQGYLKPVVFEKQFYFIGSLFFAFTVFYAYIHFSQYFIIWNANIPEETFWYNIRTNTGWRQVGFLLIFGHFFLPFLSLLRIDAKLSWFIMVPLAIWAWLMHFMDMMFNIMPAVMHPTGPFLHWIDIACFLFMAGFLSMIFFKNYFKHAPFPQRDPRTAEGLDVYVPPLTVAPAQPKIGGAH